MLPTCRTCRSHAVGTSAATATGIVAALCFFRSLDPEKITNSKSFNPQPRRAHRLAHGLRKRQQLQAGAQRSSCAGHGPRLVELVLYERTASTGKPLALQIPRGVTCTTARRRRMGGTMTRMRIEKECEREVVPPPNDGFQPARRWSASTPSSRHASTA